MEGHQRRLAGTKRVQREQSHELPSTHRTGQDPAGSEIGGADRPIGPHQGEEQESDRGAHQIAQVHAPGAARLPGARVGHQGIGGEGDGLIENEEGENVGGKGDAHGAGDGDGEADVEPGLVLLVVGAHVADRVQGGDDPQPRRHHGEEHPQRFDLEGELEAGQDLDHVKAGSAAGLHHGQDDSGDDRKQAHAGDETRRLADIRPAPEQHDQDDTSERPHHRQTDRGLRRHSSIPNSMRAAADATPTLSEVKTPKKTVAPANTQIGTSRLSGASRISGASSGGCRK